MPQDTVLTRPADLGFISCIVTVAVSEYVVRL